MNDNKTNPETCMPAACTVRAAHEAQRVADPQGITATGVGSRDQHADGKERSAPASSTSRKDEELGAKQREL